MTTNSPLAAEAGAEQPTDTQTIECLSRTWHVPAKLHLQDHRRFEAVLRRQLVRNYDSALAEGFLPADEFEALVELNPDDEQMDELGNLISKTLGFGSSGN